MTSKVKFYSAYDLPDSPAHVTTDDSLTQQDFAQHLDIATIFKRYLGGQYPLVVPAQANPMLYEDFLTRIGISKSMTDVLKRAGISNAKSSDDLVRNIVSHPDDFPEFADFIDAFNAANAPDSSSEAPPDESEEAPPDDTPSE